MNDKQSEVSVKALEWEQVDGNFRAASPLGLTYTIGVPYRGSKAMVSLSAPGMFTQWFPNCGLSDTDWAHIDAPKAAAQADYEARIRSAIAPPVEAEPVAWSPAEGMDTPDAYLAALLDYTGAFYGVAIAKGIPATDAVNAVAHIERAARNLHRLASHPPLAAHDVHGEATEKAAKIADKVAAEYANAEEGTFRAGVRRAALMIARRIRSSVTPFFGSSEAASPTPPDDVAEGMVVVPREPTEAMWGGLARAIVMWWGMTSRPTGVALYYHLKRTGEAIPHWLLAEIPDIDHVPPKGAVAVCIYRAMIAAAPAHTQGVRDAAGAYVPQVIEYPEGGYAQLLLEDTAVIVAAWVTVQELRRMPRGELLGFQWDIPVSPTPSDGDNPSAPQTSGGEI